MNFYFEVAGYFEALRQAIFEATSTIDLEMYIFASDKVGWDFAQHLALKAQQGVKVRVLYDSIGCSGTSEQLWMLLEENGVLIQEFNPTFPLPRNLRRRNHRKVLLVDGRVGFLGGFNLMDVDWRDTGLRLEEQELLSELKEQFDIEWEKQYGKMRELARRVRGRRSREPLPGLHIVPSFGMRRLGLIRQAYLRAILGARERIDITNSYFVPDLGMLRALRKMARRGIQVRILTAGRSDVRVAKWASEAVYAKLLHAGVRIFEYQSKILHAKSAVIDGRWFTVGSANIDHLSFLHNLEVNLVGVDVESAVLMSSQFESDLKQSLEIAPELWAQRSRWARFVEKFFYAFRAWM